MLAFADVHGDWRRLKLLLETSSDLYLNAGDVTNGVREQFIEFMRICGRKVCFSVPGNNELPQWIPNYMNLHGERKVYQGIVFGGVGGSPRTPFNTIFEWDEEYAYDILDKVGYVDVFVSHSPPKGTRLSLTRSGVDAGSEAVLWYIEEYVPELTVVGHIHEREGIVEKVGQTTVLNPGKRGALIEFNKGSVPRIEFL